MTFAIAPLSGRGNSLAHVVAGDETDDDAECRIGRDGASLPLTFLHHLLFLRRLRYSGHSGRGGNRNEGTRGRGSEHDRSRDLATEK